MAPRYGILVQLTSILAQSFLDWCISSGVFNEPFTFTVPRECLDGLGEEYTGVMVTISPVKERSREVNFTELSVVQAIRGTIGNKEYKPK